MSSEELLAGLTEKEASCRELLSDMRSMDKTLRATIKDAKGLISACMDEALNAHMNERVDALFDMLKADIKGIEASVQGKFDAEIRKLTREAAEIFNQKVEEGLRRVFGG